MCGIFAALSRGRSISTDYTRILDSIRHRGPDDACHQLVSLRCRDTTCESRAWLGHRRLSIIDLTDRGRQPMASADGELSVIFNGEIYNYVELRDQCRADGATFTTNTDTEVLLALWQRHGEACLSMLTGMFAFVMVDRRAGTATLVRDCFGIKPMFYVVGADTVFVCSELLALLQTGEVRDELNADIAFEYLRFGATASNERTILEDVRSLPPAHVAVFDFRTGTLGAPREYWRLRPTTRRIAFGDAVAECRERFLDNVRLHLRSDVPVGAALSGGIDSSAIVCAMRRLEPDLDLKTFSYIAAESTISEEHWVDLVHQQVGGESFKIRPTHGDVVNDMELLVRRQGEPFASASMFAQYHVFQRARAEGVPVTLDGQGADELLGGYWPHVGTFAAERLRAGDLLGALRLVRNAQPGLKGQLLVGGMLAQSVLPSSLRSLARKSVGRTLVPAYFDTEWLEGRGVDAESVADALVGHHETLKAHLIDTVRCGSLPNLLRYADRNSMAFSVESRVPFLTRGFAEFLMSLPPEYLVSRDGVRKHVFREAMKGILPEPIRLRRDKIGFFADDALWLRSNRERFAEAWRELADEPIFDRGALGAFLEEFWAGRDNRAQQVWRLLVFAYWRREVKRTLRAAATVR